MDVEEFGMELMKKLIALLTLFLSITQEVQAHTLDHHIDKIFAPLSDFASSIVFYPIEIFGSKIPITILWILIAGVIFTLFYRGIAFWGFNHAIKLLTIKPKGIKKDNTDARGEVSALQALATALSGTIGLGSIAGVAVAISIGGPGATFWIAVGAILGMSLKFTEAALAVKYRKFNEDGSISGGPMHYIAHGLTKQNLRWLGQPLALMFAFLLIPAALGGGNMLQINQATQQFISITGGENSFFIDKAWICGLFVAVIVGLIIIGGIKSIAKVTEKIVPFMCLLYVSLGIIVILANLFYLPDAFMIIIKEAFVPQSIYGGVAGTIIIGLRRSVQSNEAGTGSAPIAYATVKTKEPMSQGFVSLLEPFITGALCTLTALVIILTKSYTNYTNGVSGIELTSSAFATVIPIAPFLLAIVIILFALSTIISWAYYGQKGWTYMFGEGKKRIVAYQILFLLFIVIGSSMNLKSIVDFTDAGMLALAVPNIIAMYILMPSIKKDLIKYAKKHKIALAFNKNWFKQND